MKFYLSICFLLLIFSCHRSDDEIDFSLRRGVLKVNFHRISLNDGYPGIELLTGEGENEMPLIWFPKDKVRIKKNERDTPFGKGIDFCMSWNHKNGYNLSWNICRLKGLPGFTIRASFTNNSEEAVRLKDFILCKTEQKGLVCEGDPSTWWLLPVMETSRQAGNLEQVFPSKKRLKEQRVYGYSNIDENDPRNHDGKWRFHEDVITLYSDEDRSGIVMGAVGPAVSFVNFNYRVDVDDGILIEIISQMSEILVEPGEARVSEEVLFLAQPYKEALTNLFLWMAETHNSRNSKNAVYGWCSWYDRFFRIDEQHVVNIAQVIKEQRDRIPLQVIQIDDGWQEKSGDWKANNKFPHGMGFCADKIRDAGAIPGIWMSPVVCLTDKPSEWFQNKKGQFLDPTHPEVEQFIISSIKELKDAGYRYFKFDYNSIGKYRPYNEKMTKFEITRHLFSLYRKAIGEESFLLACGVPCRPVIGMADASRIGFDALARWKSYPLADDNLPTLCTDISSAIVSTARSSIMNNIVYYTDPDVSYILPRAESHIWQGPKDSFNPEIHGLNLDGLQTFHSYVGLLGGMTKISEPLNKPEYQQHNALRMLEILNSPAPDKGWSMNGDIDPYGRQFGFVAMRPWGNFASLILMNKEDTTLNAKLDVFNLQELGEKFFVWSFWDEEFLGTGDSDFISKNLPPHGCALLRLTQINDQKDIPVIVGSNLHISMGSAEIDLIEAASAELKIILKNVGAKDGKLFIYSEKALKVKHSSGCDAFIIPQENKIFALVINDRSAYDQNIIHLSEDNNPISADEILKNPDLYQKFIKAGFNF